MGIYNISNADSTNMTNAFTATAITPLSTDGVTGQKETTYTNTKWRDFWAYFNDHPELKAAILMKGIWDCGKGYTADSRTTIILDRIKGMGKSTFNDILFNMDVCRYIGRDSFAEIIRDEKTGILINLKPLDPSSIRIVVDESGQIIRYEQISKLGLKNPVKKFKVNDIFHLSCDQLADQIHGISKIESLETTMLADIESFADVKKIMHQQAKPFIIFKLAEDDPIKIKDFKARLDRLRNLGEDLIIPADNNTLSHEVVQLNPSAMVLAWRQDIMNKFYRALGLPLIIFGSGGSTESGGKMEYLAHEQVFEYEQRYLESQVWNQLKLRINLVSPVSMAENLMADEKKDMSASGMPQGLEIQPQDKGAKK